jgi:hypothetical protein
MINSKPTGAGNYKQGLFVPKNKDKVLKLNNQGGLFYRSGLELKIMTWLDMNPSITKWVSEMIKIPYQLTHFDNGDIQLKDHCYYPDFYYEMLKSNGETKKVIMEVKPMKEYKNVLLLQEKNFQIPSDASIKKLKNLEYDLKMAQKNLAKWETMIKYCDKKGWDFIILTEEHLKKYGIN